MDEATAQRNRRINKITLKVFGIIVAVLTVIFVLAAIFDHPSATEHADFVISRALPSNAKYFYDTTAENVECQWHPGETWNSATLTREHFSKSIEFASQVFEGMPSVKTVTMLTYAPVKDAYGNTKERLVLQHQFLRQPFMRIHWENFKGESILTQLSMCTVDSMAYVSPLIGTLQKSDIFYEP